MACSPDLLIFDEPTTALDVTTQIEVLASVREAIEAYDNAAIYITRDLDTVRAISDEIVVMYQGSVVEQGPAKTILTPPHEPCTDLLLSSAPEMDPDWLPRVLGHRQTLATRGVRIET